MNPLTIVELIEDNKMEEAHDSIAEFGVNDFIFFLITNKELLPRLHEYRAERYILFAIGKLWRIHR